MGKLRKERIDVLLVERGLAASRDRAKRLLLAGQVLVGRAKPMDCAAFGTRCTPDHPLGATMVSSEGACAAYFRYRRPA